MNSDNARTMRRKILIMGLPGTGKTVANALAPLRNAVVFNADAVRANLSRDLGFSHEDRIEHARRMGWMCDRVVEAGGTVIADFICPTAETREAFGKAFTIWVDRIDAGRFEDTNRMFVTPRAFRPARQGGRRAAILGGAGAGATPARVRSAEAYRTFHRSLPAFPRGSPTADRGRPPACRSGLHCGARHRRDRLKEFAAVLCNETAYRGGAFGPCRAFHDSVGPEHHQRLLWP